MITTLTLKSEVHPKSVSGIVASDDGMFYESLNNVLVFSSIPTRYPENNIDITTYPHLDDIHLPYIRKRRKGDLLIGMGKSHG